jgi:hypothetical protein
MGSDTVHLPEIYLPLTFEKVFEQIEASQRGDLFTGKYRRSPVVFSPRSDRIVGFKVEREQHRIQVTDGPSFFGARKECYINMYAHEVLVEVHVTWSNICFQ